MGADIRFESQLTDLDIRDGALRGITVAGPEGTYTLPCRQLILCPGHSARDTFEHAPRAGASPWRPSPLPWACASSSGRPTATPPSTSSFAGHPGLPASTYKLILPPARWPGAPSPSASAPAARWWPPRRRQDRVVTNGMSEFARDQREHQRRPAGQRHAGGFRRRRAPWRASPSSGGWRRPPIALGGGDYRAPAQRVEDFLAKPSLHGAGPGHAQLPPRRHLDEPLGLPAGLRGRDHCRGPAHSGTRSCRAMTSRTPCSPPWKAAAPPRCAFSGTRRASPPIRGLYPCGEGAGYAGGILSAAADGMRCAEAVCKQL